MSFLVRAVRPHPEVSGLNWAYVLVGIADGTILPFIPLYLLERGMSAVAIGAVLAVCAFVAVAGGLAWGYLADRRFSPERLVVLASVAAAATALLMLPFGGGTAIAVVIVMLTIARSPLTLLDPIVLRKLRVTSRTDYARIRLRMSAGWAASVIVAGATYQALGLRLIPLIYAPLSLLFGLWVWRRIHADGETAREEPAARTAVRVSRVPLALVGFLGSCFLLGVSLAATQNFLTLQISDLGGGALLVGAAAAFQALTEIPTMGYTHVLTRHVTHRVLFGIASAIWSNSGRSPPWKLRRRSSREGNRPPALGVGEGWGLPSPGKFSPRQSCSRSRPRSERSRTSTTPTRPPSAWLRSRPARPPA